MFRDPMPGEVIVDFARRLSRQQAKKALVVLRQLGAERPEVTNDRRGATFFGPRGQIKALVAKVDDQLPRSVDVGSWLLFRYDDPPLPAHHYHLVFHLSPKPSDERLREICDRVGEVPGAKSRLRFAPPLPTDHLDLSARSTACLFVHVYFDPMCDDDALAAAKQQVIDIVGVQPFDMGLLAP